MKYRSRGFRKRRMKRRRSSSRSPSRMSRMNVGSGGRGGFRL